MKGLLTLLRKPFALATINALMITMIVLGNLYYQVFCVPVDWALVVLGVVFFGMVSYPFFSESKKLATLFAFLNGLGFCILMYCMLFLETESSMILILVLFGVGLLLIIPPVIAVQLVISQVIKPKYLSMRYAFISACIISLVTVFYFGNSYKRASDEVSSIDWSRPVKTENWMSERIIGMHFIYHTQLCLYDGWRPPRHDPALVIGMRLNGMKDPLDVSLSQRLSFYKKAFPGRDYKFDCSCAIEYSSHYHNDALWKSD